VKYSLWTFNRVHYPRVMMLNLPETDVTGHFLSGLGPVQKTLMRHFNTELGWIMAAYRKAGILNQTDFVITADHGMSFIQDRLPFSTLDRAMELAGSGKVYLEADTGASLGVVHTSKSRAVAQYIARLDGPEIDATYYKVESHGKWLYRPAFVNPALTRGMKAAYLLLANTDASPSGADVLAVYAPRITTGDRPIGKYHWNGGHLGPQWDDQHIPLIIGGAGLKPGIRTNYPARLADIAPTVERLLGSPVERTDGVVLDSVLEAHSTSLAAKQKAAGRVLMPVTASLRERLQDAG
jgi:arylsulfatase A-like enzyme